MAGGRGTDQQPAATVLLVDDQEVLREGFRRHLEAEGFTVAGEASDEDAALALASRLRPAAILLNQSMRAGAALRIVSAIRRQQPDCAVVAYSSFADAPQDLSDLDADATVATSWSRARVAQAVREALRRRGSAEGGPR